MGSSSILKFELTLREPSVWESLLKHTGRLDTLHTLHMTLLDPTHSNLIHSHVGRIHATGRRSRVLEVGAVSESIPASVLTCFWSLIHTIDREQVSPTASFASHRLRAVLTRFLTLVSPKTGAWAISLANAQPFCDVVAIE